MTHRTIPRHLAIRIAFAVAVPVVGVAGIARTSELVFAGQPTMRLLLSALALFLVALCMGIRRRPLRIAFPRRFLLKEGVVAAGTLSIAIAAFSRPPPGFLYGSILAILIAAYAEEYVFRWSVPKMLASAFSDAGASSKISWLTGYALAQVMFVVCHFAPVTHAAHDWADAARLFAAGILYSAAVATSGLGVAAGVHATMNITLSNFVEVDAGRVLIVITTVTAVGLSSAALVKALRRYQAGRSRIPPIQSERQDAHYRP